MFTILLPKLLRLGGGSLQETPSVLRQLGAQYPVVVTDQFFAGNAMLR